MLRALAAAALTALVIAGPAHAQSAKYVWTGYGINVPGSSKCPTYKMTIDITVAGNAVKAKFLQEGRTERHFEATKDPQGNYKTEAVVGGGNIMQVSGKITEADSTVLLDGYCKFGGHLTKK